MVLRPCLRTISRLSPSDAGKGGLILALRQMVMGCREVSNGLRRIIQGDVGPVVVIRLWHGVAGHAKGVVLFQRRSRDKPGPSQQYKPDKCYRDDDRPAP